MVIKVSNEIKVAVLAIVAFALGFWGFKFLKGRNMLTTATTLYVKYGQVDQLQPSSPVFIRGLQVGMVKAKSFTMPTCKPRMNTGLEGCSWSTWPYLT